MLKLLDTNFDRLHIARSMPVNVRPLNSTPAGSQDLLQRWLERWKRCQ